jgi:hypothetical protein
MTPCAPDVSIRYTRGKKTSLVFRIDSSTSAHVIMMKITAKYVQPQKTIPKKMQLFGSLGDERS